jgi:hypothetical protein
VRWDMKGVSPCRHRRPVAGDDSAAPKSCGRHASRACRLHVPLLIKSDIINSTLTMARTVAEIQKLFLSSPRYAVVGASKDQSKYGTKVRAA